MKKIVLFLVLAISAVGLANASEAPDTAKWNKVTDLARKLYSQERYDKCLEVVNSKMKSLTAELGEADTTYYPYLQLLKSRCEIRTDRTKEAISSMLALASHHAKYVSDHDELYAQYLDNAGLYCNADSDFERGMEYSHKALEIYDNLRLRNYDLGVVLMHVAEASFYLGKYDDAVRYDLRALDIIKDFQGEHSDEYIGELPYLQQYYTSAGQLDKAAEVGKKIEKLKGESDNEAADIPDPIEFKTAEEAHSHNNDALRCCDYYLNHTVKAERMDEAATYIMRWMQASADVHVVYGEADSKMLMSKEEDMAYLVAFTAGCSRYALNIGEASFTEEMYVSAVIDMLNFYYGNRELIGKNSGLEKYISCYEKNGKDVDKLEEMIKQNYAKIVDEAKDSKFPDDVFGTPKK